MAGPLVTRLADLEGSFGQHKFSIQFSVRFLLLDKRPLQYIGLPVSYGQYFW